MRESVIYQEIRAEAIAEGRAEGRQEGEVSLILRLLKRHLGEIAAERQTQIRGLSVEQLEELVEAVLDFNSEADLVAWLQARQ